MCKRGFNGFSLLDFALAEYTEITTSVLSCATMKTNDADLVTKFLDGQKILSVMEAMGLKFVSGRSALALKAAWKGLS